MAPAPNQLDDEHRIYDMRSLEVGDELARYTDWLVTPLLPLVRGRVLEIGAGLGAVADRYVHRADEAVLVEPARNLHATLAARMAGRPGVHTRCAFLDQIAGQVVDGVDLRAGSFDLVVLVNVLEHIEDDRGTMALVRHLLRPGGQLFVFVPALPVLYGADDRRVGHVRRYTRRTLRDAVEPSGLVIERLTWFDLLGTVPWFVHGRLLRRDTVATSGARLYDRVVVPVCRAVDRLVGPPVGKNLVMVARVPDQPTVTAPADDFHPFPS